jgi:RNA polymerase sigma-70 factor (ECF subfamily)
MRYVNNRETARDLVQEGFIKVFTKGHTFHNTGAFAGWIRRIFVTTALEYLRTKNVLNPLNAIDDYSEQLLDTDYSALDRLSADELLECVARLPAGYRTVFNMFAIEGYSHSEIAQILGISEVTSRTQFIRARNSLQKSVQSLINNENVRQQRSRQNP